MPVTVIPGYRHRAEGAFDGYAYFPPGVQAGDEQVVACAFMVQHPTDPDTGEPETGWSMSGFLTASGWLLRSNHTFTYYGLFPITWATFTRRVPAGTSTTGSTSATETSFEVSYYHATKGTKNHKAIITESCLVRGSTEVRSGHGQMSTDATNFLRFPATAADSTGSLILYYGALGLGVAPNEDVAQWANPSGMPSGTTKVESVMSPPNVASNSADPQYDASTWASMLAPVGAVAAKTAVLANGETASLNQPAIGHTLSFTAPVELQELVPSKLTVPHNLGDGDVAFTFAKTNNSDLAVVADITGLATVSYVKASTTASLKLGAEIDFDNGGAPKDRVIGTEVYLEIEETIPGVTNSPRVTPVTLTVVEGYAGPKWGNASGFVSGTGNITLNATSLSIGDLFLMFLETANEAVAVPAGWTQLAVASVGTAASTTATRLTCFYKYATTAGPESVVITDPGNHVGGIIHLIRGARLNSVPTLSAMTTNASNTTAHTFPAFSTPKRNTLMIAALAVATDVATARVNSWTQGYTERSDNATTQGNGGGIGVATRECLEIETIPVTQATVATTSLGARFLINVEGPDVGEPEPPIITNTGKITTTQWL